MVTYKSLEQQICELWASRGLEVIEESVETLGKDKFKWTIIAKKAKTNDNNVILENLHGVHTFKSKS